jgi:hypothetical protein
MESSIKNSLPVTSTMPSSTLIQMERENKLFRSSSGSFLNLKLIKIEILNFMDKMERYKKTLSFQNFYNRSKCQTTILITV